MGFAFLDDFAVGVQEAEASDGIEAKLSQVDFSSFIFRAPANGRPVLAGQSRFLHLEFSGHCFPPWVGSLLAIGYSGIRGLCSDVAPSLHFHSTPDLPSRLPFSGISPIAVHRRVRRFSSSLLGWASA